MNGMTFEEWVKDQFKSKVWNALEDISMEYCDLSNELQKEAMEEAVEWFIIKFYDEYGE